MEDLVSEYQTFEHDVLVVGAGGAGLRAAIAASALICGSPTARASSASNHPLKLTQAANSMRACAESSEVLHSMVRSSV